ncbi:helix-turn-helix transcriptional regulator [Neobacillus sp. PS3-40]|uniref:helix-turn-helix domain-containing protein n=1 Tax=Neobacillus sp. PS3-40 TaxID=3070679 RepID=UPI0027E2025B|nr:helix-turn-helix transcriptional regulator [Neobacillus sp. PS3-40]WML46519.1 helix-turn-helix transcriptional regulator [Neobacillus sp. PS3-40]
MSKIKKLRVLSEMTQEQLAEQLGVSQSYLSLLERNQRDISPEVNRRIEEIFSFSVKFID